MQNMSEGKSKVPEVEKKPNPKCEARNKDQIEFWVPEFDALHPANEIASPH